MRNFTTFITALFVFLFFSGFGVMEAQDTSQDTIRVQIELPNGQIAKQDTVTEGDSLSLSGLPFPLHIMNGGKVVFADSSVSHDITITITLPSFANIDQMQNKVNFGDSVANAAQFTVTAGDSTIDPFQFDQPVTLTLPIPQDLPSAIGEKVSNLMLAYRDTTGDFDTNGIRTVARDSVKGIVKAEVSHFSSIAMTSDGIADGGDTTEAGEKVTFKVETPGGGIARADTVSEGSSFRLSGFAFPLQYLNGSEIVLPDSAVAEDVTITVEVPQFARIDSQQNNVSFGDSVASAVTFNVMKGDSTISPFEFDTPITLKLAIPNDIPEQMSGKEESFTLAFVDSTGAFDTTGVGSVHVDSAAGIVSANIAHFSTVAMTSEGQTATSIESGISSKPESFKLYENYPNPFNPTTTIAYDLKEAGLVTLTVYNMLGKKVATLVDKRQQAGHYSVRFDASDLASGIYLYRIQAENFSSVKKMTLIK